MYLYSLDERFSAFGRSEMLESDMNPLGDNSVSDQFVYDYTDGSGIYVEHLTGSSLVKFEWHSLRDY